MGTDRGVLVYGTDGTMMLTRSGYILVDADGKMIKEEKEGEVTTATQSGNLVGGGSLTENHIMNFGEVIRDKSVKQNSPITEGSISTNMSHYANMAYRTKEEVLINPVDGTLKSSKAQKYWKGEYEEGWEPKV